MAKIDKIREQLGLLKFFLGVVITAAFAVIGYIFTSFSKVANWQIILAGVLIIPLIFAFIILYTQISVKLNEIERE